MARIGVVHTLSFHLTRCNNICYPISSTFRFTACQYHIGNEQYEPKLSIITWQRNNWYTKIRKYNLFSGVIYGYEFVLELSMRTVCIYYGDECSIRDEHTQYDTRITYKINKAKYGLSLGIEHREDIAAYVNNSHEKIKDLLIDSYSNALRIVNIILEVPVDKLYQMSITNNQKVGLQ